VNSCFTRELSNEEIGETDETGEDDKAGDTEVKECAWVLGEQKSALGYQGTLVKCCVLHSIIFKSCFCLPILFPKT
jgi:hypothetical protein